MVLAVPITMQVPAVGASRSLTFSISASSKVPARYWPQRRRQSVQAPSTSPLKWPTSIGPTGSTIAGTSALAAAISCAGTVLSQPPISTTASIGWARIISSVSIDIRLRRNMLVGMGEALVDRDGREVHRQPAGQHDAALHRLDQLGHVAVAGVVVAEGVGDADDRPVERVVGVAARP